MTEVIELVVRNIDGEGVLFTRDGKEIGHQVKHQGHYWYEGQGKERKCYYRATFEMSSMKDSRPQE